MTDVELVKEFIIQVVSEGRFGRGAEFLRLETKKKPPSTNPHFCSSLSFFIVHFQDGLPQNILVKRQPASLAHRKMQNTSVQFYNEKYFYEEVLPFVNTGGVLENVFPRYYYGSTTGDPPLDTIVLEDLSKLGFKTPLLSGIYFDWAHCELALRQLGLIHAHSYLARRHTLAAFEVKVVGLQEPMLSVEDESFFELVRLTIRRAVAPLIEQGVHTERIEVFLERSYDTRAFYIELLTPEPNTGVVCHGDYCGNNMMFKYGEDGRPVDMRCLDLQCAKYSSPAIDLSFFLCLNIDQKTKTRHWDEFIEIYYDSLSNSLPGVVVPTFENILAEFSRKAVIGFLVNSVFLPVMLEEQSMDFAEIASLEKERQERFVKTGGERGTQLFVDLVRFMLEKHYI